MRTSNAPNLESFIIPGDFTQKTLPSLPVVIPKKAFRIHPTRKAGPVFIRREEDGWYLVPPELVKQGGRYSAWRAMLYEGIRQDGQSFILPVTQPFGDIPPSWRETLLEAIKAARRGWIQIAANKRTAEYEIEVCQKISPRQPDWPEWNVEEWFSKAFLGRFVSRNQKLQAAEFIEDECF